MIVEVEVLPDDVLSSLESLEEEDKEVELRDFIVTLLFENKSNDLVGEVCCLLFDHLMQEDKNHANVVYEEIVESYENNRESW